MGSSLPSCCLIGWFVSGEWEAVSSRSLIGWFVSGEWEAVSLAVV